MAARSLYSMPPAAPDSSWARWASVAQDTRVALCRMCGEREGDLVYLAACKTLEGGGGARWTPDTLEALADHLIRLGGLQAVVGRSLAIRTRLAGHDEYRELSQ